MQQGCTWAKVSDILRLSGSAALPTLYFFLCFALLWLSRLPYSCRLVTHVQPQVLFLSSCFSHLLISLSRISFGFPSMLSFACFSETSNVSKNHLRGLQWLRGSVVKGLLGGPEFKSQHLNSASKSSIIPASGGPLPSFGFSGHQAHT